MNPLEQLPEEKFVLSRQIPFATFYQVIFHPRQGDPRRDQVMRIKPQRDMVKLFETFYQQPGCNQQDDGNRNLACHKQIPDEMGCLPSVAPFPPFKRSTMP